MLRSTLTPHQRAAIAVLATAGLEPVRLGELEGGERVLVRIAGALELYRIDPLGTLTKPAATGWGLSQV